MTTTTQPPTAITEIKVRTKDGTRMLVRFTTYTAHLIPRPGGAAFNLPLAQFNSFLSAGYYTEGWK